MTVWWFLTLNGYCFCMFIVYSLHFKEIFYLNFAYMMLFVCLLLLVSYMYLFFIYVYSYILAFNFAFVLTPFLLLNLLDIAYALSNDDLYAILTMVLLYIHNIPIY